MEAPAVQAITKSILAFLLTVALLGQTGCQKGGDSATTAAVNGASSDKAAAKTADGSTPAKSDQDPLHPVLLIETSMGGFKVRLDGEKAPLTVDNFLTYVSSQHYDQTIFHQVLKEYPKLALGGAFLPNLTEKKTRTPVRNEAHNGLKNRRGTIGMARRADNPDSATCHFYVNLADNEMLDYKDRTPEGYGYCVFGEVTEGLDVVDKIVQAPVRDTDKFERLPTESIAIKSIRRIR
jgi:peptidyl-prolyl cis-trans isomerase B (cyclophilin B)